VAPNSGIYANALPLPELAKFLGETLAWLPDIEISRQNMDMADLDLKLDLKIAKGGLTPAISIGGSVSSGYTGGTSSWGSQFGNNLNEQISVSISIPVWNRGKVKSGIKQSKSVSP